MQLSALRRPARTHPHLNAEPTDLPPGLFTLQERYYTGKLGIKADRPAERRCVVASYLEGLLWVLDYYYRGVVSWTWFYPYYYAPMASDLVDLDTIQGGLADGLVCCALQLPG